MKARLIFVLMICHALGGRAQVPQRFSFQGVARRADGKEAANVQVSIRVSILSGSAIGTLSYQEIHGAETTSRGVFDIAIGGGAVQSGDFSTIDWAGKKHFIKLELDPEGGSNYLNFGVSQLLSVPYAMHSATSFSWLHNQPVIQSGTFQGGGTFGIPGDGSRLIWYPRKAAFAAGYTEAGAWNDANIGEYSVAFGNQAIAKGSGSAAFGSLSIANGQFAIAGGEKSVANGDASFAVGSGAVAKGYGAASLGAFNDSQDNPAPGVDGALPTDRIFQIGNGLSAAQTSNAFTILRNGNIGIGQGAVNPAFRLDVDGRMRLRHRPDGTAGLYFDNSQNTVSGFVGMINDQKTGFYIGNKWRFQVMNNGNVGIGESVIDPEFTLDLGGRARIRHTVNATAGIHLDNSSNVPTGFVGMVNDQKVGFFIGGKWHFQVAANGNVGIGDNVIDPAYPLDVGGRARIRHKSNTTAGLYFDNSSNSPDAFVGMISDEKVGFYLGNKWRFQLKNNGNVGIGDGVTDPEYVLDLGGRPRVRHQANATAGIHFNDSQNNTAGFVGMAADNQLGLHTGGGWRFWVDNAGNGFMRSKLGIGEDIFTPQHALDVDGRLRLRHKPGRPAGIYFDAAKTLAFQEIGVIDTAMAITMSLDGPVMEFKIRSDGGDFFIPFKIGGSGAYAYQLQVEGTVVAGAYITQSDVRLKRDVKPLLTSDEKLCRINGYNYYWKDKQDQSLQTGVLAQEVEQIFPELVKTDEKGFKSVNYIGLIPHLIESMKTLQSRNKDLNQINAGFAARLSAIEKNVEAMKNLNSIGNVGASK